MVLFIHGSTFGVTLERAGSVSDASEDLGKGPLSGEAGRSISIVTT